MQNPLTSIVNLIKRKAQRAKYKHKVSRSYESQTDLKTRIKNFALHRSRLGLLFILFLFIIGFVGLIFINIKAFIDFDPKAFKDSQLTIKNEWNGSSKLTILLIGTDKIDDDHIFIDHLSILSIDPNSNKFSIFVLSPDLKLTQSTIGYTLHYRTIFNNRELNNDKLHVLIKSVENLLAFKIDRYIMADKNTFPDLSQYLNTIQVEVPSTINDQDLLDISIPNTTKWEEGNQVVIPVDYVPFAAADSNGRDDQLKRQQNLIEAIALNLAGVRSIFNFSNILKGFENTCSTNMGKLELTYLMFDLLKVRGADIKKGYLRESNYSKVIDMGFYEAISPDINKIDNDLSNIFFDLEVFKEQARIEVLNGSGIRGLATNRSRWVKNIGGRVIHIGNSYDLNESSIIYCSDPSLYPVTINELQRVLGSNVEIVEEEYPNRHVGDIVLVLGSNNEY